MKFRVLDGIARRKNVKALIAIIVPFPFAFDGYRLLKDEPILPSRQRGLVVVVESNQIRLLLTAHCLFSPRIDRFSFRRINVGAGVRASRSPRDTRPSAETLG